MTIGPYLPLLALLLFLLSGAAVTARADMAVVATDCTVTAATSLPDDAPAGTDAPLVGTETSPEAPWEANAWVSDPEPGARVDAQRRGAVASPPAVERGGPLLPPPKG